MHCTCTAISPHACTVWLKISGSIASNKLVSDSKAMSVYGLSCEAVRLVLSRVLWRLMCGVRISDTVVRCGVGLTLTAQAFVLNK